MKSNSPQGLGKNISHIVCRFHSHNVLPVPLRYSLRDTVASGRAAPRPLWLAQPRISRTIPALFSISDTVASVAQRRGHSGSLSRALINSEFACKGDVLVRMRHEHVAMRLFVSYVSKHALVWRSQLSDDDHGETVQLRRPHIRGSSPINTYASIMSTMWAQSRTGRPGEGRNMVKAAFVAV